VAGWHTCALACAELEEGKLRLYESLPSSGRIGRLESGDRISNKARPESLYTCLRCRRTLRTGWVSDPYWWILQREEWEGTAGVSAIASGNVIIHGVHHTPDAFDGFLQQRHDRQIAGLDQVGGITESLQRIIDLMVKLP
jgi:hypothetical protein